MKRLFALALMMLAISAPAFSAQATGSGRVNPAKVRYELHRILAAPEYNHHNSKSPFEKWSERVGKTIRDAVVKFFRWLIKSLTLNDSEGASVFAYFGICLIAIGFLVLLGLIIRRLFIGAGRHKDNDASPNDFDYEMPSAKPLIRQAAKLAEAGDYRGAFKTAYLASIAYLDEIRALHFERSRTNWEYLRELKRGGHEKPHSELRPLTLDFDRKIYGREDCCKDDYVRANAVYDHITSEETK